jgi:hypothetical protein
MAIIRTALACILIATSVSACQKTDRPPTPTTSSAVQPDSDNDKK